ncbi:NAD(P)-dependent oxidoreductase [Sinorhizobium americanum]|uniref:6-phosphogluconate dehydrogenase n=1 Tax=Sinorhizobium americanum TaxID=194963 RepID=A0A1L3LP92_9HYPH|nr:NAD(P)-binding domain-containing protein [Sinorhizobium americanum]APG91895.1 6-phosphogluconate dehydrogenase [Sinorhizobium americanum]OAP47409.1 6-phosphogluconate dehydrogenase [Sinorhizobium americanum]TCN29956.1 6-phosphogluconate dehydrogenase-like protein [Sinorhizobium americanum]
MTSISVLGLGAMGAALAATLIRKGHAVTVWNRTPSRAEPLARAGARIATTPAEAVAASELSILCVVDYAAAGSVLAEARGALSGRDLVNLTNGTPREAKNLAAWAEMEGVNYLDGGIMAIPPMIGEAGALVLYSGSTALFERHKPALDALAESRHLGDDSGLAALYDLALLAGMYGLFSGFLHANALVTSGGGKAVDFLPLLLPWLKAMTGTLPDLAGKIDSGRHSDNVVSNLAMQTIALENIAKASAEQAVAPDFAEPMLRLAARRIAEGHGSDDVSGVIETVREKK